VTELIRVELAKQLRRPRTYLTFATLAVFDVVLTLALLVTGPGRSERIGDIPLYLIPKQSGFTVGLITLASTMKFFLPLAVAVFAGESVAGEAGWGSLRYLLMRPEGRGRVLASKLAVAAGFSFCAVVLVPLVALLAGLSVFGWHPLVAIDGSASSAAGQIAATFSPAAAFGHLALGSLYVAAGMTSIFAFAFCLSTMTSQAFVAVAGGVGLTIVSRVINADYLPGVAILNKYMPNNDVDLWQHLFQRPAQTGGMSRFLLLQAVYVVVFMAVAWWRFTRHDVLA
jgi:ABC-2 type transport system permease protein